MPNHLSGKYSKRNMQRQAAWLVSSRETGGGMTYDQLGAALGRSGGWAHHVAHGNFAAISPSDLQAQIIHALYLYGRSRGVIGQADIQTLDEVRDLLGMAIAKLDELARKYDRKRSRTRRKESA